MLFFGGTGTTKVPTVPVPVPKKYRGTAHLQYACYQSTGLKYCSISSPPTNSFSLLIITLKYFSINGLLFVSFIEL